MSSPDDNNRFAASARRQWIFWGAVFVICGILLAVRPSVAWWARHTAEKHLYAGRVSQAEQWLNRAARFDANSTTTQILIARCYRHRDQKEKWREAIEQIEAAAEDSDSLRNEKRLAALQWGEVATIAASEWERRVEAGADRDDAALAIAHGLVLAGKDQPFQRLLDEWEEATGHPQQVAFLRGIFWRAKQDVGKAESSLRETLAIEPDHEMAHVALAQVTEYAGDFSAALEHFTYWAQHRPGDEQAVTGWSRNLRQLGRADEAKDVMQRFAPPADGSVPLALEWAQVEYALGNYDEAARWFQLADLNGPHFSSMLRTAATAFALQGDVFTAETIFERVIAVQNRQRRIEELQKRVVNDPSDLKAASELQKVAAQDQNVAPETGEAMQHPVSPLYARHCASCHGAQGNADGPGSRHLYPPARNLRTDSYRLITGTNGQPSLKDIEAVIRDGMPGTSMPSFAELPDEDRTELAAQVLQLRKEGMRSQLTKQLSALDPSADDMTVEQIVRERFDEVSPLDVPQTQELSSPSRIAAGRTLYEQAGCVQCHGPDGRGALDVPLFNEDGSHAIARDIVFEPWKGGESPEALFARLRLGMPGTPHPENPTLDDDQIISLVAYCLSISKASKQSATNRERFLEANRRALEARFGPEP